MDNATFVESWNSIIPHKIKPADLEHPTESFMCRSLVSFFRMMKYDVSEFDHVSVAGLFLETDFCFNASLYFLILIYLVANFIRVFYRYFFD